jgi:hypothetical protein
MPSEIGLADTEELNVFFSALAGMKVRSLKAQGGRIDYEAQRSGGFLSLTDTFTFFGSRQDVAETRAFIKTMRAFVPGMMQDVKSFFGFGGKQP